ncbi:hypothetical protein HJFPF1_00403 [Paramyrothecium foliicola]|nr:hypothetical protein HJFPF1_00403 [Paramyrothecium foliicola]
MSARGGPGRLAIPAVAATTIIGAGVYYSTRPAKDPVEQRRDRVQAKRSEGLAGAGVGGNAVTGGSETGQVGSGTSSGTHDKSRKLDTGATLDQLPSGGVGGGVGGGGTNTRATELASKKDGQKQTVGSTGGGSAGSEGSSSSGSKVNSGSEARPWSQSLQGMFGQGGASATDDPEVHGQHRQTKVASNLATAPTKNPNGRQ